MVFVRRSPPKSALRSRDSLILVTTLDLGAVVLVKADKAFQQEIGIN